MKISASNKNKSKEMPVISFDNKDKWEKWLSENHDSSTGIYIRIFKKSSGETTVTYDEALDVALCFGWIDGIRKSFDEISYLQKFSPRTKKSIWSKRNKEHVARLIASGNMQPAGLKEIEAAKADGRWEQAYDSPKNMTIPEDFLKALSKNKKAKEFFNTLNKTNLYSIGWRLQTAKKPETREKRIKTIIEMLEKGEMFHS